MENLNYNLNSWHCRLYRSTYGIQIDDEYKLPKSICGYFWKLLFAIIISPLCFIGHIINIKNVKFPAASFLIFNLLFFLMGHIIIGKNKPIETPTILDFIILYFTGFFVLGTMVAIILGFVFGAFALSDYIKEKNSTKKASKPNVLVEGFKSFKNKYCKKINWN